jgi:hypothetical protein
MSGYSAHAIDDLSEAYTKSARRHPVATHNIALCIETLKSAVKFSLPDLGDILDWKTQKRGERLADLVIAYARPFRLPFPVCAIEFAQSDQGTPPPGQVYVNACIAIAEEVGDDARRGVRITPIMRPAELNRWLLSGFSIILYEDGNYEAGSLAGGDSMPDLTIEERRALIESDFGNEMRAVVQLIAALSCLNVRAVECHPDAAINKRRTQRGKTPFHSFHVLEIVGHDTESISLGGTHASPRVHLRRGHIRRLPKGPVWVNACVVGNKALGMVTKEYRVSAPNTRAPVEDGDGR